MTTTTMVIPRCSVTTGKDGTFAIGPVPAGTYHVKLGPLMKSTLLREATVTAAGDEHLGDLQSK